MSELEPQLQERLDVLGKITGEITTFLTDDTPQNNRLHKALQPWYSIAWIKDAQVDRELKSIKRTVDKAVASDVGCWELLFNKINELANSGYAAQQVQAEVLTRMALVSLQQRFPKGPYFPGEGEHFQPISDQLKEGIGAEPEEKALPAITYSAETVSQAADALQILEEDQPIACDLHLTTSGNNKVVGGLTIHHNQVEARLSLAQPPAEYPLADLSFDRRKVAANQSTIIGEMQKFDSGKTENERREKVRPKVEEGLWFGDVVTDVIQPRDPQAQMTLAFHGLASPGLFTSESQEAANRLLLITIGNSLSQEQGASVVATDRSGDLILEYTALNAKYRVKIIPIEGGGYELVLASVPVSDRFTNSQDRIQDAVRVANGAIGIFTDFVQTRITQPAILQLPEELEQMTLVEYKELGRPDLTEDLEFVGGLPNETVTRLTRFINGTIAYAAEEITDKPDALILVGKTGLGKSTLCLAAAREFAKTGVPIYTLSERDAREPTPQTLIRALQGFNRTEGGVLIIDDVQHFLNGTQQENNIARAALLRILQELNKDREHILILNTEDWGQVSGTIDALGQSHRGNLIRPQLELSQAGIKDLLQAVLARVLTSDQVVSDPNFEVVAKNDPRIQKHLQRLCRAGEKQTPEAYIAELIKIAQEKSAVAPVTPGVVSSAFKDALWELPDTTMDEVFEELKGILTEKELTILRAETERTESEAARLRVELAGLRAEVTDRDQFLNNAMATLQTDLNTMKRELDARGQENTALKAESAQILDRLVALEQAAHAPIPPAVPLIRRGRLGRRE